MQGEIPVRPLYSFVNQGIIRDGLTYQLMLVQGKVDAYTFR